MSALANAVVMILIPFTIVCFAVFFHNIERAYWHTFWETKTGKTLTLSYFTEGKNDQIKSNVLRKTKHHWVSKEQEIKKWIELSWERWNTEKPEWFDDKLRALVPVEYIPKAGGARRKESVRRASVDAEAEGGLAGTLRASIRRVSVGVADG
jgi:hypothetical protein